MGRLQLESCIKNKKINLYKFSKTFGMKYVLKSYLCINQFHLKLNESNPLT